MDRLERGKKQRFLYVTQFNLELLDAIFQNGVWNPTVIMK